MLLYSYHGCIFLAPCDGVTCDFGICKPDSLTVLGYRCMCADCVSERRSLTGSKVCGSDNVTYESECLMRRNACLKKTPITVAFKGSCGK